MRRLAGAGRAPAASGGTGGTGGRAAALARSGLSAAAGLLLAFAALLALPLQAQADTLVSNIGQASRSTSFSIVSQPFTTGGNSGGYTLTSVGIDVATNVLPGYLVRIVPSASSGEPDLSDSTKFITLTSPAPLIADVVNTFTAPASTTLTADTTYHVYVTRADGGGPTNLRPTNSIAEDNGAAAGWSIGDTRYWKSAIGSGWSTTPTILRMQIDGTLGGTTTNTAATGQPSISGTAQVGQTLTASTSGIMDADGLPTSFTYEWVRADGNTETPIAGETSSTYTPAAADVGKTIKVTVSFTDDAGNPEGPLTSDATATVTAASSCAAVWCATLTVQSLSDGRFGCAASESGKECYDYLTEDEFSHDSTEYEVTGLQLFADGELRLFLALGGDLTTASQSLVLLVGSERFPLAHADTKEARSRYWKNSGLSWSSSASVDVRLVEATASDATLSDLEIVDGNGAALALSPPFGAAETDYTASVEDGVFQITVTAAASDASARLDYLDRNGNALTDADPVAPGHQVVLDAGETVVQMQVTAEDGTTTTYRASVTRMRVTGAGLVTNLDNTLTGTTNDKVQAQAFTTGSHPSGYRLTGVVLRVTSHGGDASSSDTHFAIWSANNGPGELIAELTSPPLGTGLRTYAAPEGGVFLDPDTTYFVVGNYGHALSARVRTRVTRNNRETSAYGWSIANGGRISDAQFPASWATIAASLSMRFEGDELPGGGTNTAATGKPTITGTAQVGETLTAATTGITDADGKTNAENGDAGYAYTYQWVRVDADGVSNETDITGETSKTYILAAADVGKKVKVKVVSFTDDQDNAEGPLTSDAYPAGNATITAANTAATGQPAITGTAQVGQTLTASTSGIMDDDGLPASYTYQWVRVDSDGVSNETNIGSDASTYTPSSSDVGNRIRVKVSFTDNAGNPEGPLPSDAYPSEPPGATVVAAQGSCPSDADWCATLTMGYASGTTVQSRLYDFGFISSTNFGVLAPAMFTRGTTAYTVTEVNRSLTTSLDGNTIKTDSLNLQVSGGTLPDGTVLNVGGTEFTVGTDSATTNAGEENWDLRDLGISFAWVEGQKVAVSAKFPATNTAATGKPGISGTAAVGQMLTATTVGITDADGKTKAENGDTGYAYTYQWILVDGSNETDISGEMSSTYTPSSSDVGKTIRVRVSFTDDADNAESPLPSEQTAAVTVVTVAVSIAADHDRIGAGLEDLVFTLTRPGATTAALDATVTIVQEQSWLGTSDLSHTVTFAAGSATATLTLAASRFSFDPDTSGDLTATVSGAGIAGGEATVEMVSTADAPITISYDKSEYTFAEDAANVNIYVVATLDPAYPRAPSRSFLVTLTTVSGTAISYQDFAPFTWGPQFDQGDYELDGNKYVARKRMQHQDGTYFAVEDDEVYEGPERLVLKIERHPSLPSGLTQFAYPDGDTCEALSCSPIVTYPVLITDEEDRPVLSLSAAPASISEVNDDTTTNVAENASVLTVSAASPKTFATGQTVTLSFGGSAVYGTHYGVSPVDADANTTGHQVLLPAETSSVEVTVTAVDNATVDGGRTIEVVGSLDGTEFHRASIAVADDERANTAPEFVNGASVDREVAENTAAGRDIGAPVRATDPENDTLEYSLDGTDAASFDIDRGTGQLQTKTGVDYDHEAKSSYSVTVAVNDGYGGTDTIAVTVGVTDEDEPPLAPAGPGVAKVRGSVMSLKVSWRAPDNAGRPAIAHYDLRYRTSRTGTGGWMDGPQDQTGTSATIRNLVENTEYQVQVRAANAEGDGEWSAPQGGDAGGRGGAEGRVAPGG